MVHGPGPGLESLGHSDLVAHRQGRVVDEDAGTAGSAIGDVADDDLDLLTGIPGQVERQLLPAGGRPGHPVPAAGAARGQTRISTGQVMREERVPVQQNPAPQSAGTPEVVRPPASGSVVQSSDPIVCTSTITLSSSCPVS